MELETGLMLAMGIAVAWAVMDFVKGMGQAEDDAKLQERLRGNIKTREEVQAERARLLQRETAKTFLDNLTARFKITAILQKKLNQADFGNVKASNVLAITLLVCIGVLVGGLMYFNDTAWIAIMLAPIPFGAMWYGVDFMVRRRTNQFVEQMPDTFDLMIQCLRAGHALTGAIGQVGDQMPDPIGKEFARVYHEQNLGKPVEEAMKGLSERIDAMDVKMFVSAVLIQRTTGGDLAEVLEKISDLIRQRIELYGQVRALTAEGKLSGYVLLSLPPICLLYIAVVNPEYADPLFNRAEGQFMLLGAAIMMLLGVAMIKKIVTIEV